MWPAIRLGLAAEISALAVEFDHSQWLAREEIETGQLQQFRQLLQFAATHSPYYATRFAACGADVADINSYSAFRKLPLLTRQEIQSADEAFFCTNIPTDQGKTGETQTSGSTGEPVRVRKTGISQLFLQAFSLRNHDWDQVPFNSRLATIRPGKSAYREQSNWGAPHASMYATGPAQIIPITTPVDQQVRLLNTFQPEMLLVYPSNLRGLLDRWRDQGFELSSLTHIRTIGETLADELREYLAELIPQVAVRDGYSSEECGAIALQCPDAAGYHVMSESLIVEILGNDDQPCAPGDVGRIVITDLHNLASPIIRYDIGDYARAGDTCSCGRGLMKLDDILGRQRNLVVKPNGDRHWPLVGFRNFAGIAPIRQYQMVQETLERIVVHCVTDEPLTDSQKTALIELIQSKLGHEFELEILDQRNDLPRQPGGKFEEFISKVS